MGAAATSRRKLPYLNSAKLTRLLGLNSVTPFRFSLVPTSSSDMPLLVALEDPQPYDTSVMLRPSGIVPSMFVSPVQGAQPTRMSARGWVGQGTGVELKKKSGLASL